MLFFGLISAVLIVATLGVVVWTAPQGKQVSFSVHAASRKWTYWLFGVALTACGTAFTAFLVELGRRVDAPEVYFAAVSLGWILTLLTAWIPDKTGEMTMRNPHWVVSYGLAVMMTVIVGSLSLAHGLSAVLRLFALGIAFWYLLTLYLWLFVRASRRFFLVFQILNIGSFFAILIGSAIWGGK